MMTVQLQVLFRKEEESWSAFARRAVDAHGDVLLVLGASEDSLQREEQRRAFLEEIGAHRTRIRLATHDESLAAAARKHGVRVIENTRALRTALAGHASMKEALRLFSPQLWRQEWRSRLQSMGLLSLPKLRIWTLILMSVGLFLFVLFKLLPSAEIRIWPRGETASQTTNIFLVQSGATVPSRARSLPLTPIDVTVRKSITFDQISKQFIGTNAQVSMTVVNKTDEEVSLKEGTRFVNQAGMVFKITKRATVPPQGKMAVPSKAEDEDMFNEIIGERGNVPAGLKWTIPALDAELQKVIYGENRVAATGGRTAYRTVLQQGDLDLARKRLEQELLAEARSLVQEELIQMNQRDPTRQLRLLSYDQLVKPTYSGFVLPTHQLNQPVSSISAQGTLIYRVLAYDAQSILDIVGTDLMAHVSDGKKIIEDTVNVDHIELRVFDYADDLSWIKSTVELTATEQYILDPLTPPGAKFAKKIRDAVTGESKQDALRIVKNLPEVEKAEISLWPPWGNTLPDIPSHISISIE